MRPRLLNPLRERSHERADRRGHERRAQQRPAEPRVIVIPTHATDGALDGCGRDLDAERVRRAGGPLDVAVYTCSCGYVFSAAVSTTVACPHCGSDQAW
jgi:predicted Zn-ribbon and HTH transcriptional regulator